MQQESRSSDFDVVNTKKDVKDSLYYQNLQKSLSAQGQPLNPLNEHLAANAKAVKQVEMPDTQDKVSLQQNQKSLFQWKTSVTKEGDVEYEVDVSNNVGMNTSILTGEKSLGIISVLGLRIDLRDKLESFINKYIKNFVQARSHNLMVAKFAQFNVAITGQILSMLGMSAEEIRKLQKEALKAAIEENMQLFAENEYNGEMIAIVGGGSKKEIKAQQQIISEMRTQFTTQMERLGNPNYYTAARITEIQIEQVKKIITSFYEEKNNLEFQLHYLS